MRLVLWLLVLAAVIAFDYYSADWGEGDNQTRSGGTIEYQMPGPIQVE